MKSSVPQGTRDFPPQAVYRRRYILDTLRAVFEQYGFQPLETPAFENLSTLTGKYGEEGDRLIFKILNNGLHEKKDKSALNATWAQLLEKPGAYSQLTERALRYDLTIPFARFVSNTHSELPMPFKRYQMQPVWRADRPGRGRYREFWQCDCDVVGSASLLNEADLLGIYRESFARLRIPGITVHINSRKILEALAEVCGAPQLLGHITTALDKLDKIQWTGVNQELEQRGVPAAARQKIEAFTQIAGSNEEKLDGLEQLLGQTIAGKAGVQELRDVLNIHSSLQNPGWSSAVQITTSLARGLDYYTGLIVEVSNNAVHIGSLGGGGRYDELTALFDLKGITGVGISFGLDRIYDVLQELNLFPENAIQTPLVTILNFGADAEVFSLAILRQLREAGVACELYPDSAKLDKQMRYAGRRGVQWVVLPGEEERKRNTVSLRNMLSGEQEIVDVEEAVRKLSKS